MENLDTPIRLAFYCGCYREIGHAPGPNGEDLNPTCEADGDLTVPLADIVWDQIDFACPGCGRALCREDGHFRVADRSDCERFGLPEELLMYEPPKEALA